MGVMRLPRLLFFLGRNCLLGIAVGWGLLAAILALDLFGFGELLFSSRDRWTALLLVGAGFAITFGSLAMGTAVFLLSDEDG